MQMTTPSWETTSVYVDTSGGIYYGLSVVLRIVDAKIFPGNVKAKHKSVIHF